MDIVQEFLEVISDFVTGFWPIVITSITQAISIFWNSTTGLTPIGVLGLFGLGVGLVYLGMSTAMRFFRKG